MYDDVKIELKGSKETLARLKYVAAKGRIRTLQRIRQVQEEEQMKELEKVLVKEATSTAIEQDKEAQELAEELTANEKRALALAKARAAKAAKNAQSE